MGRQGGAPAREALVSSADRNTTSGPAGAGWGPFEGMLEPMGNFQGGSAFAMARQVSDGFVLVTERTFKRLSRPELETFGFELERLLREIRGEQPDLADQKALQERNRKIQRLNSCRMMLQGFKTRNRIR